MHTEEPQDRAEAEEEGTPVVEQARGVLVGAGCATPEFALKELVRASREHGIALEDLAAALVEVASGRAPENTLLRKVVWQEWGDIVPDC